MKKWFLRIFLVCLWLSIFHVISLAFIVIPAKLSLADACLESDSGCAPPLAWLSRMTVGINTKFVFVSTYVRAQTPALGQTSSELEKKIQTLEQNLNETRNKARTLSNQIVMMDSQISLTELRITRTGEKIAELEKEITALSGRIVKLEFSLSELSRVLLQRIVVTYKKGSPDPMEMFLSAADFSDFLRRTKYLKAAQAHDRRLLLDMQTAKDTFADQKTLREAKKTESEKLKKDLEVQKITLARQKKDKELLLEVTKNDEKRYQQLLSEARREREEIQKAISLITSAGEKKKVGRGDPIGLMGNTGFSTGPHLHFGVYNLTENQLRSFNFDDSSVNPAEMLRSRTLTFDSTACDDVPSDKQVEKSVGGGNWDWPMSNPKISQCYGHTPWSWRYRSGSHNGLDMYDKDNIVVKSVDEGTAYIYRGGDSGGNGVFIFHPNGKMSLYWHLR